MPNAVRSLYMALGCYIGRGGSRLMGFNLRKTRLIGWVTIVVAYIVAIAVQIMESKS